MPACSWFTQARLPGFKVRSHPGRAPSPPSPPSGWLLHRNLPIASPSPTSSPLCPTPTLSHSARSLRRCSPETASFSISSGSSPPASAYLGPEAAAGSLAPLCVFEIGTTQFFLLSSCSYLQIVRVWAYYHF